MEYEDGDRDWVPLLIAVLLALLLVGGGAWWFLRIPVAVTEETVEPVEEVESPGEGSPESLGQLADPTEGESSQDVLDSLGVKVQAADPEDVARLIAAQLEAGNFQQAASAMGDEGLSSLELQRILGANGARPQGVREVGELETNRRKRFAVEFGDEREPLYLDLAKREDGQWEVESARLADEAMAHLPELEEVDAPPGERNVPKHDALHVSDAFLQAALAQEFEKAKRHVDTARVSDAKIAAMCILFEEGHYRLDPVKPLKVLFNRERAAGYLANVLTGEKDKPAQFTLSLVRPAPDVPWRVSEINLDALLADYADRVAGGDVYYTPLVPKPEGGDRLVLFFGFDQDNLVPRTERQLSIVADVLKTDPNRKLTISGHADALGSEDYNRTLSAERAEAVRRFLVAQGVRAEQIVTIAAGEAEPLRPNETEAGEDNPEGRRANRRTEIYLDF
ncbi:MAG: OmpA family protein [Verrucomicrobiota bacterium JB023]|nr:OmpA family protein [Verrucomicrobiota bacterium JB023]